MAHPRPMRVPDAVLGLALVALVAGTPARASAQDWLIFQGIAETEFWASDSGSRLLTHNDGKPGVLGRFRLFAGVAPSRRVQLIGLVEAVAGSANRGEDEVELEGLVLRVSPARALTVEAGK